MVPETGDRGGTQCFAGILVLRTNAPVLLHVEYACVCSMGWGEEHTYIPYCFIERFESGLLIVMVDASVPVQDGHAFPLSFFAVTSVHAVIRAVVPLAGEHIQTLWWGQEKDVSAVSARSPLCAWGLNPRSQNCTPHVISVLVSVTGTHGPTFTVFRPYSEIRN